MTSADMLLDVLGDIDEQYIEEIDKRISFVKKRKVISFVSVAAVFVILCTSIIPLLKLQPNTSLKFNMQDSESSSITDNSASFDGLTGGYGGCSNYGITGYATCGYFYYEVPSDGIYRYTPSEGCSEKIVNIKNFDTWYDYVVNDIGLYYTPDNKILFKIEHNSDRVETLYSDADINHLTPYPYTANDIQLSINKTTITQSGYKANASKNIVIDGITGEEKTTLSNITFYTNEKLYNELFNKHLEDPTSYTIEEIYELTNKTTEYWADEVTHQLGDRTLVLKYNENGGGFYLTENGKRIEDYFTISGSEPIKATDDYIVFSMGQGGTATITPVYHYYIARANGNDSRVVSSSAHRPEGDSKFFYYIDSDGNITSLDVETNEKAVLKSNKNYVYYDLYSDGEYLYLFKYIGETSAKRFDIAPVCYEIIKDENGKPCELKLFDDNIVK